MSFGFFATNKKLSSTLELCMPEDKRLPTSKKIQFINICAPLF